MRHIYLLLAICACSSETVEYITVESHQDAASDAPESDAWTPPAKDAATPIDAYEAPDAYVAPKPDGVSDECPGLGKGGLPVKCSDYTFNVVVDGGDSYPCNLMSPQCPRGDQCMGVAASGSIVWSVCP